MANILVKWVLPTTRESGKPLQIGDIKDVEILLSADGGVNFGSFGKYVPTILETLVTDLEPGEWFFAGVVTDNANKSSKPVKTSLLVPDTTPPGTLISLLLNLQ